MIIDGHAHTYPDHAARRVIHSFVEFHHMEPTASIGEGTVSDLRKRMRENGVDYTVLANFAPEKSLRRTNEWTLSMARAYADLIPLISVCPGMPIEEVRAYFKKAQKASRCIPASRISIRTIPDSGKSMPSAMSIRFR